MKYKKRVNSEKKKKEIDKQKNRKQKQTKKQKTQRSNKPQYYKYYTIVIKFSIFVFICELIVKLHWLHPCCDISTDTGIIKLCSVQYVTVFPFVCHIFDKKEKTIQYLFMNYHITGKMGLYLRNPYIGYLLCFSFDNVWYFSSGSIVKQFVFFGRFCWAFTCSVYSSLSNHGSQG